MNKDGQSEINKKKEKVGQRNMDKMKEIYNSIIGDENLKKHINTQRNDRIKFIQQFPYDNLPHNETFVFNNLCMFNDISCVYGYVNVNDNVKMIDFDGSYKLTGNIHLSQRCLLPENLFYQKFDFKSPIKPLDEKTLSDYVLK